MSIDRRSGAGVFGEDFGATVLLLGTTFAVLGILVDIARVAPTDRFGTLSTHLAIAVGALAVAGALRLGGPTADGRSRWLRPLGQLATAVVLGATIADLTLSGRSGIHWLTIPHALIAAATALLLFVSLSVLPGRSGRARLLPTAHLIALLLLLIMVLGADYLGRPNLWRSPGFYLPSSAMFPALLAFMAGRFDGNWNATLTAGWYTLLAWGGPTVLITLDATAPVSPYALAPPPILLGLLLPALATDLSTQRFDGPATRALATAVAFVGLFIAFHWLVAPAVLGSPAADLYPALDRWPHGREPHWPGRLWVVLPGRRADLAGVTLAGGLAMVSAYVGFRAAEGAVREEKPVRTGARPTPGN